MRLVAIALLLVLASPTAAQNRPLSIEQLETIEKLDKLSDSFESMDAELDALIRVRRSECQRAFGHAQFCGCIMDKLPIAWSFAQYVAITTRSQADNGYDALDVVHQSAYDQVQPIREECVAKMGQ